MVNIKQQPKSYDAIVIGSGITGGWAAKELTQRGLETLVLEAGRSIDPKTDYAEHTGTWDMPFRGLEDRKAIERDRKIQGRTGACDEIAWKFFVNDVENPYTVEDGSDEFLWIRGRQVGGRSIVWGRQSYRWSDLDFEANAKDGFGTDWPIRYADLAPWYHRVEGFAGISGRNEGLHQLPDGNLQPQLPFNCMEERLRERLDRAFSGARTLTAARAAVLTQDLNGRKACHYCGPCKRGCQTRSYFSSLNATLPAAGATGKMTLRPHSVVSRLLYDADRDRLAGVQVIDAQSQEVHEFHARVVFLCASTIESARLLLLSANDRFPEGLANSSGQVGRNLLDHHFQVGASGEFPGELTDTYVSGRRPNGCYLPRFANIDQKSKVGEFLRGYGYQCGASRGTVWRRGFNRKGFGGAFKDSLFGLTPWRMRLGGFGETLPNPDNRVTLDPEVKDKWGLPAARVFMKFTENEHAMRKHMKESAAEMLEAIGAKNVSMFEQKARPGFAIHEMGTCRMGRDPKTSVLNGNNQSWDIPNLFITDGSSMASTACQNPSLTYMALTARACDYAYQRLDRAEL